MTDDQTAVQIKNELLRDVAIRLFDENSARIKKCLGKLSIEQIWWKANPNSNSIGNLILHMNGNVRQWILTGIDGQKDIRQRQSEFEQDKQLDHKTLFLILDRLENDTRSAMSRISTSELLRKRPVQIYNETGISILIHVTEHFSYHTGQIAFITKMLLDDQVGFYENLDLG
jgi:uncharacterized damage-inducible protein DinB